MAKTLDSEIKEFINGLPYWAKYICSELISGKTISEELIDSTFSFLLEDLNLKEKSERPEFTFSINSGMETHYSKSTFLKFLSNIEGVNALAENQTIEFSPKLTILYGLNGSGKSGYIRLLKNALYSKDKGEILGNINQTGSPKEIKADFVFSSSEQSIKYPKGKNDFRFNQFAVFDGIICQKHLCNRNDFSFRPAGLSLFSDFNNALEKINNRILNFKYSKPINNPFADEGIFIGDSVIKTFLVELSHKSNIDELKKSHLPFTDSDKSLKIEVENKYDDLKIALSQKDKEIKKLGDIKGQIKTKKQSLDKHNSHFIQTYLDAATTAISNCIIKQNNAKEEGIDKFQTLKIKDIGTDEWKAFIQAAENFSLKQKVSNEIYPLIGDNCIFCQQPILDDDTITLIKSFWTYIKSYAEQEAKNALEKVGSFKKAFKGLNFNLFPETDVLTIWLNENYTEELNTIHSGINDQTFLSDSMISAIDNLVASNRVECLIDISVFDIIESNIDEQIKTFQNDEQNKALLELEKSKTYLAHKEKLQQRILDIENLYKNMIDVTKINLFNKQSWKTQSTNTEKRLSNDFFNKRYIETFNKECENLKGNFGIDIDHKSSDAHSNRQLFLKGRTPSIILSEGEQKVIALADFIAESYESEINNGIILDDPVTSLDEERKSIIADRLISIATEKQVIVFTHDLVFISSLINAAEEKKVEFRCHWVEKNDNLIGNVWLDNSPSFEKKYKKSGIAQDFYIKAKEAPPQQRESLVKSGFAALRSSYEAFVIFDLFGEVVVRFNDRVSIDRLVSNSVYVDHQIVAEIMKNYALACRYMEGHIHSDKFLSKKPTPEQLNEEIQRLDKLKNFAKEQRKMNKPEVTP